MNLDLKKITESIKKLEKKHGKGVVMDLSSDKSFVQDIKFEKTGIFSLDEMLGGGIPQGRVIELYGQESSGKTSLATQIAAQFQKNGKTVAFLDLEHAFAPKYAEALGIDLSPEKFLFSQPDWGEQALDIIENWVNLGVELIIVDSVANMVPKCEVEGKAGDAVVGKVARLMSQAMRRLSGPVSKNKATILFINQIRQNIGGGPYANPNVTPGGNALKFWASMRIQVARRTSLKIGEKVIGIKILAKTVKNKVSRPFRQAEFDFFFEGGFQLEADILESAVRNKIIKLKGRTYSFGEEIIGTSKGEAVEILKTDKILLDKITNQLNLKKC